MSTAHLDLSRLLAQDMRQHLDEAAMMRLLRQCGGFIIGDGEEWHVKIGGARIKSARRGAALNQALDIIATRPDLWPQGGSAA